MPLATIADLLTGDPAEVRRLLGKASTLSERYEGFLDTHRDDRPRHPGIHASEISGCPRRPVYSLLGTERRDVTPGKWRKRFKIGHAVHDMFQRDFAKMTGSAGFHIEFESEVRIAPELQEVAAEYEIYSHTDGLFTVREEPGGPPLLRVVLEMKTMSPAEYEKIQEPKPEHVEQAHVYMKCLDAPVTWFLYYNKGNQNFTPSTNPSFLVRFNPKIWDGLASRFDDMLGLAAVGQLPDRAEGVCCEFCDFSWTCQPAYLAKRATQSGPPKRWLTVRGRP